MRHSEPFDNPSLRLSSVQATELRTRLRAGSVEELPNYLRERLELLRKALGNHPFTVGEAHQAFSVSRDLTYKILQELTEHGLLRRLGRGVYAIDDEKFAIQPAASLSEAIREACAALVSDGIRFFVTGLDMLLPFTQHLLVRYPHLVYVERGSGEWAKHTLVTRGYKVALDPGEEALELALDLAADEPFIIVRETTQFYGAEAGKAEPEKALVDLYFEVTRAGYPLSLSEMGRIFFHFLRHGHVNYSRLLHAARRRGLEAEMRRILKDLSAVLPIPDAFLEGAMEANERTTVIKEAVGGMLR